MKVGLKTSFLSMLCVFTATAAVAVPSVRTLGGDGTYDSAAVAAAIAVDDQERSASLRSNNAVGMIRNVTPKAGTTTNGSALKKASISQSSGVNVPKTSTQTLSRPTTTVGRAATTPRLSIGSYVGVGALNNQQQSISTSSGAATSAELLNRIDVLEQNVENLTVQKQNSLVLGDDSYLYFDPSGNGELVLDVERLQNAMQLQVGADGKQVELGYNDWGLLWRYAGETDEQYRPLISFETIRGPAGPQGPKGDTGEKGDKGDKGDKGEPGESVDLSAYSTTADMNAAIVNAVNTAWDDIQDEMDELNAKINGKVDVYQGPENADNILIVNQLGNVDVAPAPYTKAQVDEKLNNLSFPTLPELATVATTGEYSDLNNKPVLGALSSKNQVESEDIKNNTIKSEDIADDAIERRKMANDIQNALKLVDDVLLEHPDDNGRHVLGVVDGEKRWLPVIGPDDIIY